MKIHLIKKKTIEDFIQKNANSKTYFENWIAVLKRATWQEPSDILKTFNSADILGKGSKRIVFNIGGNHYRVICKYHFGKTSVHLFIKWIGSHANYTKLCNEGNQYLVDLY